MKPSTKTFQVAGKWTERKTKTAVTICLCGNKFIKTKETQLVCIWCSPERKVYQ
jgi:hypothetical protein